MAIPKGVSRFNGASPSPTVEGKSGGKRSTGASPSGGKRVGSNPARKLDGTAERGGDSYCVRGNAGKLDNGQRVQSHAHPEGIEAGMRSVSDPRESGGLMSHE